MITYRNQKGKFAAVSADSRVYSNGKELFGAARKSALKTQIKKETGPESIKEKPERITGGKEYVSKTFGHFVMDYSQWRDKKSREVYAVTEYKYYRASPTGSKNKIRSKVLNRTLGTFTKGGFEKWLHSGIAKQYLADLKGEDGKIKGFVVKYDDKHIKRTSKNNPLAKSRKRSLRKAEKEKAQILRRYKSKTK
jgi:hypothetical protein